MEESIRPAAAQTQLVVHGCTYSWQLHLMAVSISLLCADMVIPIMLLLFLVAAAVVEVIIQCTAVVRLRLKFSCSSEIIESNAPVPPLAA